MIRYYAIRSPPNDYSKGTETKMRRKDGLWQTTTIV